MPATCFNFRCLPVSHFLFVLMFFSTLATLITIQFMTLCLFKTCMNWENEDPIFGSVYHSLEVFRMDYAEMERKFKIYMYPDGDGNGTYQTVSGKYASEGYFFKNVRESSFLTDDPDSAHLFFIPLSCHRLHQKVSSYDQMASIVGNYVEKLVLEYPYWNRSLGADHFFLTCHDIDVQATEAIPHLIKNSIRVVCSAGYGTGFIPHKDVSLPMVMQPFTKPAADHKDINRTILGYWEGLNNTNLTEMLIDSWREDEELDIQSRNVQKTGHRKNKFYASKFCICPAGSRLASNRITMAIHYGCVPVILADYYDLPFNDVLDWRRFSITLKEDDIFNLKEILKANVDTNYAYLHYNLLKVQKHFRWNTPPVKYDAFHMVLYELWTRRSVSRYQTKTISEIDDI